MSDKGWITHEQLAKSIRIARDADSRSRFMGEYMGDWPARDRRCERRSLPTAERPERCPNKAQFIVIAASSQKSDVCDQCLTPYLMSLKPGTETMVIKL